MANDRKDRVLRTVIDLYVSDGVPVSSNAVKRAGGYSVSTATIRNHMAALENEGCLAKPHPSAGRVPTDGGYRRYVDDLQRNCATWGDVRSRCRRSLRDHARDVGEIMSQASQLLGEISRNFGVVYGSLIRENTVEHVRFVRLGIGRLLVVVNLKPAYERTAVLRVERDLEPEVVSGAERMVNAVVEGRTLDGAKAALDTPVRDNVTGEGIIAREVSIHRDDIFSEPPAVDLYYEERSHLLEQPELSEPKNLQLILKLLHNKNYLTTILSERSVEGTQVTIGAENEDEALQPFSLITAGYRMGVARGVLGIIGPTRMRYDIAITLVASVSRELRAIGEEYF